jgi:antitoxin (DNA-binding transcriptional repressor) of toxin-antitoxin stability system
MIYVLGANSVYYWEGKEGTMSTTTLEDASSRLLELVDGLTPGSEILITRNGQPVARLMLPAPSKGTPVIGRGKGKVIRYIEDDEHLVDFAEYFG